MKSKEKQLTRVEAWTMIRRAFRNWTTYAESGSKLDNFGLCNAVNRLASMNRITPAVCRQMHRDILSMKPADAYAYYWRCTKEGARQRVKAINLLFKQQCWGKLN